MIAAFVKEEAQIKAVIPLVQDLATAKGMNLSNAADLVAKTLGSSTNALARYGIEVKGTIGSTERLDSLVNGLNNAFGGQAKAAAETGVGALKQLQNAYGDLLETIGSGGSGFVNENARFLTALIDVINSKMKEGLEQSKTDIEKFQDTLKSSSENGLNNLLDGWNKSAKYYRTL